MNTANASTANLILDALSTEDIASHLAARGLAVTPLKAPKAKVEKVEKTPEELLIEAVSLVVTVGEDGKLVVVPATAREAKTDAGIVFEALSLKSRTTLEKIADAKKPPVEGKKRGPKSKEEKARLAAAAAANPDGSAPAASGDETPAA